jgi:hypothetical protein
MRSRHFGTLALLLFTSIPHSAKATAIANSHISFSNLKIVPAAGEVVFLDVWTADAFARAQNSLGELVRLQPANPSVVEAEVDTKMMVRFARAHSIASAEKLTATADSDGNIPETTTAQALSRGAPELVNFFKIIGGSGSVPVVFSIDVDARLSVSTDAFGQAETDTTVDLEVNGIPIVFRFDKLSIGPNAHPDPLAFSKSLSGTTTLSFNSESVLFLTLDAESEVINKVSEPSAIVLVLGGLLVLLIFPHKLSLCRRIRIKKERLPS